MIKLLNPKINNVFKRTSDNIMGGNALKNYETRRYNKEEFIELASIVQDKLFQCVNTRGCIIPYFNNKTDFGDLDLILNSNSLPINWVNIIIHEFNLTDNQWIKNGNVLSIGVNNFQIDLINTPNQYLVSSLNYFSYNDLGNLLGRLFHKLGLKLSHKGLNLVVRSNENAHILKEIELTQSYSVILNILGLSYAKFVYGFDNIEDVYNFVCESKYFDKDIYLLNNRSHKSRIRDRKRITYSNFLKYIQNNNIQSNYSFKNKSELGGYSIREPYYSEIVLELFPHVKEEIDSLISEFELNQKFKNVYNGKIVSEITGLTGKELGSFMSTINFDNGEIELGISNPEYISDKISKLFGSKS